VCLLDSLPENDTVAELCSGEYKVAYDRDLEEKLQKQSTSISPICAFVKVSY
jgi:hypothetical protein